MGCKKPLTFSSSRGEATQFPADFLFNFINGFIRFELFASSLGVLLRLVDLNWKHLTIDEHERRVVLCCVAKEWPSFRSKSGL